MIGGYSDGTSAHQVVIKRSAEQMQVGMEQVEGHFGRVVRVKKMADDRLSHQ